MFNYKQYDDGSAGFENQRTGVKLLKFNTDDSLTLNGPVTGAIAGTHRYVDTVNGDNTNDGLSWATPYATMAKALTVVETYDHIHFVGDVREELTATNLAFDVTIQGHGNRHRHPGWGTAPGSATWRPPASPTATTPLLKVRAQGWRFIDILFDCPVDSAAIYLERNALSGTSEYDAGHAEFYRCRFESGKWGIQNAGGSGFVGVYGCKFYRLTESGGAGIICTSTSVAVPLNWEIKGNHFANNASHILSSMSYSLIKDNAFGRFTATLAIDIDDQPSANQGEYNIITGNYLSGTYGATAYPPGSNNEWAGNFNSLSGGVTADDPA
jgi:hypothetical protein